MTKAEYYDLLYQLVQRYTAQLVPTRLPGSVKTLFSITGSKGKTSTSVELCRLIPFAGRFISPHCFSVRERFGTGLSLLSEQYFASYFDCYKFGFFGNLVNAYLNFLDTTKSEVSVCEAGIGGLYDTTNVPFGGKKIGILTSIELEHCNMLGPTVEDIAYYKLGYFDGVSRLIVPESLDMHGFDRFYGIADRVVRVKSSADKMKYNTVIAHRAALEAGIPSCAASKPAALPGRSRVVRLANGRVEDHFPRADASMFPQLERCASNSGTAFTADFFIDSAHTQDSIRYAVQQCKRRFGKQPITLVFSQTKSERNYLTFLDDIISQLNVQRKLYLPASSSLDFTYSQELDRNSLSIGLDLVYNSGFEIVQYAYLQYLKGNVFVVGSEHGACVAEWLLFNS